MRNTLRKLLLVFGLFLFLFFVVMRPAPAKAGTFWVSFGFPRFYYGTTFPFGFYNYNPIYRFNHFQRTSLNWAKMRSDTEMAIQLTEFKKQEYFARKELEKRQDQKNQSQKTKKQNTQSDDLNEVEIEIKSPDDEIHPLESIIFDDGAVAINYY